MKFLYTQQSHLGFTPGTWLAFSYGQPMASREPFAYLEGTRGENPFYVYLESWHHGLLIDDDSFWGSPDLPDGDR